jgi:hypothetical protein
MTLGAHADNALPSVLCGWNRLCCLQARVRGAASRASKRHKMQHAINQCSCDVTLLMRLHTRKAH